jgi:hypothetical protein
MLTTVKHERAETWRPVQELGRGANYKYGEPESVTDEKDVNRENRYYDRPMCGSRGKRIIARSAKLSEWAAHVRA